MGEVGETPPQVGEWEKRITEWRQRDSDLLRMASADPLDNEVDLEPNSLQESIVGRQKKFLVKLAQVTADLTPPRDEYYPGRQVIRRAQELLTDDNFIEMALEEGSQDVSIFDNAAKAFEDLEEISTKRRLYALMNVFEEKGDPERALICGYASLLYATIPEEKRSKILQNVVLGDISAIKGFFD